MSCTISISSNNVTVDNIQMAFAINGTVNAGTVVGTVTTINFTQNMKLTSASMTSLLVMNQNDILSVAMRDLGTPGRIFPIYGLIITIMATQAF